ncbi:MAG TPA: response regulator [Terracidiphilus sp.]|nr:response regulator [Terracidiphilus sp.]
MKPVRNNARVVVIVDDEEPFREALASVLKAAGLAVTLFASAEEFLDLFDLRSAACLILDVRLPGMSGIELQRRLHEAGDAVPIIFVTGHGDDRVRELVLKAGAVAFLTKPVRSGVLLAAIQAAISGVAPG